MKSIKKGQIDPNSSEFMRELEKYMESDSPSPSTSQSKTTKIDIPDNLEYSEDYLKNKELTEQARKKPFSEKFYGKEPLTEDLKKKLEMMEYSKPIKMDQEPNIHKKGSVASKYIEAQRSLADKERKKQEVRSKQLNLEQEVAEKRLGKKLASESLNKPSRFSRVLKALGSRVSKAIPFLGAGVGALAAKEALARGDKLGAALETASTLDPTPISDIVLAGKDIYDIATEKDDIEKTVKPMIKAVGGDPDMNPSKASKLSGEKESPDLEEMEGVVNYEDYLKKKKRQLGY